MMCFEAFWEGFVVYAYVGGMGIRWQSFFTSLSFFSFSGVRPVPWKEGPFIAGGCFRLMGEVLSGYLICRQY